MNKIKFLIILNLITFTLVSCGSIKDSVSNNKRNNSDEFLVEKKSPLVMPPDYNKLPEPRENENQQNSDERKFEALISNRQIVSDDLNKSKNITNSFEESFLEKIKNN